MTSSRQPTHHGYAVNVKDQSSYRLERGLLSDDEAQAIWDDCAEYFWLDAQCTAKEHGFRTVYSEGHSGGWCVPQPQPDPELQGREWEAWLNRFRAFEGEILSLLTVWQDDYAQVLAEAVKRANAEPAERAYWESRDVPTVDA